ncbi:hypothetical protein PCIT_a2181 [Pseudoalteromonas citrea]|uniref:Uncharacterized protein n=1 Tax=Pseudoalteromonas citrea TaxID=43655 RepID=A0AAD4FSF1_9GAMM|nr:hypothetical protein PCIT_a2181 [Pseudoalteromonas citrea]
MVFYITAINSHFSGFLAQGSDFSVGISAIKLRVFAGFAG